MGARAARWRRTGAGLLLALGTFGAGAFALAEPSDRATAEAALREVEAAPAPRRTVATELVQRAKQALDRAAKLRSEGDEPHAKLAEAVARTWAEAARDTLRAVELEDQAAGSRLAANDAGTMAERERALLEEGVAQAGRLRAQLEAAAREPREGAPRVSGAAKTAGRDAGAPPPASSARKGGAR